jgi:UDP-3-O-[3-hydroxymyristoyl] glucosamine N-acyltransferase
MADSRFYKNCGPFTLGDLCNRIGLALPADADSNLIIFDVAALEAAGAGDITFCADKQAAKQLLYTRASACFIGKHAGKVNVPLGTIGILCATATEAIANALRIFYPDSSLSILSQDVAIHLTASIGVDVVLAHGVVIGPYAEIGARTRIGANTVIGPGVAIGTDCEIGSNSSIVSALIGDGVLILSGAQIGSPGFGFVSGREGHLKIPQVGRVIIQDKVEIGSCTTIDRGMLGDTVIGEGTKIDNLVQIGHNTRIGRHCIIVSQVGISGSCEIGDFVVMGGQVGIADHVTIGDGARFAARSGVYPGKLDGGQDYGGTPARPVKQWLREVATLNKLGKSRRKDFND